MKQRIALFDNLKGFAILMVVVGHFATRMLSVDGSHLVQTTATYIYFFHMPLFIFASGLFAGKAWYKKPEAPVDKVILYLALYLIFCLGVTIFDMGFCGASSSINPFVVGSAPWFMLALTLFFIMVPILGSFKPLPSMICLIVIATAANTLLVSATELTLSRFFVYLPYFAIGFYLQPERITSFVKAVQAKITPAGTKIVAWTLLVGFFLFLYLFLSSGQLSFVKQLSSGLNLLPAMAERWDVALPLMCALRIVEYFCVSAFIAVIILAMPMNKSILTFMGERSFQVYIVHMFIMYTIDVTRFNFYMMEMSDLWVYSVYVLGPITAFILALPKAPNNWVKNLGKLCKKITQPPVVAAEKTPPNPSK